jgi:hypothetical protein
MTVAVARKRGEDAPRLLCDGGALAPEDCRVFGHLGPGGALPDGWAAAADPFGRVTRRDVVIPGRTPGDRLELHLCDRCMSHVLREGRPPDELHAS